MDSNSGSVNVVDFPTQQAFNTRQPLDNEGQFPLYSEEAATEVDYFTMIKDMSNDGIYDDAIELYRIMSEAMSEAQEGAILSDIFLRLWREYIHERYEDMYTGSDAIISKSSDKEMLSGAIHTLNFLANLI